MSICTNARVLLYTLPYTGTLNKTWPVSLCWQKMSWAQPEPPPREKINRGNTCECFYVQWNAIKWQSVVSIPQVQVTDQDVILHQYGVTGKVLSLNYLFCLCIELYVHPTSSGLRVAGPVSSLKGHPHFRGAPYKWFYVLCWSCHQQKIRVKLCFILQWLY